MSVLFLKVRNRRPRQSKAVFWGRPSCRSTEVHSWWGSVVLFVSAAVHALNLHLRDACGAWVGLILVCCHANMTSRMRYQLETVAISVVEVCWKHLH